MTFSRKTFTLIEILVVVVIVGILAATLISRLQGAQARTRDVIRKKDIKTAADAVSIYYQDYQEFPCPNPPADLVAWNKNGWEGTACAGSTDNTATWWILSILVPQYISKPINDPLNGKTSRYAYILYPKWINYYIAGFPNPNTWLENPKNCNMTYVPGWVVSLLYRAEVGRSSDWFRSCPDGRPFETLNKICGWGIAWCFEAWEFPGKWWMRWLRVFDDKVMAIWDKHIKYPEYPQY